MNPDTPALKAFKNLSNYEAFQNALKAFRFDEDKEAFRAVHSYLVRPDELKFPMGQMARLVKSRLIASMEFIFSKMGTSIESKEFEDILAISATSRCLSLWINSQPSSKEQRLEMAMQRAMENPSDAVQTVLAEWFVTSVALAKLPEAVKFFAKPLQPNYYTSRIALLGVALKRDKDGIFTANFLNLLNEQSALLANDLETVKNKSEIFDDLIKTLPLALGKVPDNTVQSVLGLLFNDIGKLRGDKKRRLCSRLVRLSASFLDQPAEGPADQALKVLDLVSSSLSELVPCGTIDKDACAIHYHGQIRVDTADRLTADGAKVMALAIGRVREGSNPLLAMEATAFNLGMRPLGDEDKTVIFDPKIHHDTQGGALPGDQVRLSRKGWMLGTQVIERAEVQPI